VYNVEYDRTRRVELPTVSVYPAWLHIVNNKENITGGICALKTKNNERKIIAQISERSTVMRDLLVILWVCELRYVNSYANAETERNYGIRHGDHKIDAVLVPTNRFEEME